MKRSLLVPLACLFVSASIVCPNVMADEHTKTIRVIEKSDTRLTVIANNVQTVDERLEYRLELLETQQSRSWTLPFSPIQKPIDTKIYDDWVGGTGQWRHGNFAFFVPHEESESMVLRKCYQPILGSKLPRVFFEERYPRSIPTELLETGWKILEIRNERVEEYDVLPRNFLQYAGESDSKNVVDKILWSKNENFILIIGSRTRLVVRDLHSDVLDSFVVLVDLSNAPGSLQRTEIFLRDSKYLPETWQGAVSPGIVRWSTPTSIVLESFRRYEKTLEISFEDVLDENALCKLEHDNT